MGSAMTVDELYIAMNGRLGSQLGLMDFVSVEKRSAESFAYRVIEQERERKLAELGLTYGGLFGMTLHLGFALKQPGDNRSDQEFEKKRNALIERVIKEAEQLIRDHYGNENVVMGDELYFKLTQNEEMRAKPLVFKCTVAEEFTVFDEGVQDEA